MINLIFDVPSKKYTIINQIKRHTTQLTLVSISETEEVKFHTEIDSFIINIWSRTYLPQNK